MKLKVTSLAVKKMNPDENIEVHRNRVGPEI